MRKRSSVLHLFVAGTFLTSFSLTQAKPAIALDDAFQWWQPVYLDCPLAAGKKLRGYLESSPRLNDNLDGINQFLLRSAIGYRFKKNLEVYQGYGYQTQFVPSFLQENRLYQQVGYGHVLHKRIQVLHRFRSEQRFIEYRDGECANRLRYLLRLATPFRDTSFYLTTSNELFVNLNSVTNGPNSGIDQNRLYTGLGRQMNEKLRVEVGYQFQYVNRADPTDDKGAHQLLTQAFISL